MLSSGLSSVDFKYLKSAIDEAAIVAITDSRGTITYANKKFCEISKYPLSELLGQNHRIINSGTHPKEFFTEMWKTISSGQVWEGEIRNRAKDGTYYWVHTTIVPFLNNDGKPEQYVSVRYEITERKLFEEQLKINAEKLRISNRELEEFASVAAHDLQEPLRKIQAFVDRLNTKGQNELSPDNLEYLKRIQNSAARMQSLINDLLSYSRVSTRAQPFQKVDLNRVIADVISDLQIRIEKSDAEIEVAPLPTVFAEPIQMHQLFMNLINNAIKFHKPGVPPKVRISAREEDSMAYVEVTDNGIGFDEKYLDRIFTIFQRLHGRHEYEGTGIGLAVCRKIVDRHGGQLTASSRLGEGSVFKVVIPTQPRRN